jgi:hypothetical protein
MSRARSVSLGWTILSSKDLDAIMIRGFVLASLAAIGLMGCGPTRPPTVAIALSRDAATWTEQRRLCVASPQGSHCDVYLRNATPPAPYTTDGILIQQRRLCVESPSVANCTLAQQMARDAEAEAARSGTATAPATSARRPEAQVADDDDADAGYAPMPATTDTSTSVTGEPLRPWRSRRSRARPLDDASAAQCSDSTLAALDLAEPATRAAILRRCASVRR